MLNQSEQDQVGIDWIDTAKAQIDSTEKEPVGGTVELSTLLGATPSPPSTSISPVPLM